jgi:hypothetical protein
MLRQRGHFPLQGLRTSLVRNCYRQKRIISCRSAAPQWLRQCFALALLPARIF